MKESFFRLKEQFTEKINFEKNNDFKHKKVKLEFHFNIEVEKIGEMTSKVILNFSVFNEKTKKDHPFFISVTQVGIFEWSDNIEEKVIEEMLYKNAPAALLSYIRGIISQITAFSGYPALIIPLMNFN